MKRELQTALRSIFPSRLHYDSKRWKIVLFEAEIRVGLLFYGTIRGLHHTLETSPGVISQRDRVYVRIFSKAMWAWSKVAYPEDGNCVTVCPQPDIGTTWSKHTLDLCVTFDTTDGATGTGTKNAAATNAGLQLQIQVDSIGRLRRAFAVSAHPQKPFIFFGGVILHLKNTRQTHSRDRKHGLQKHQRVTK